MDRNRILKLAKDCAGELIMILCGGLLLFFPDSAVALVTKILAWLMVCIGVFKAVKNLKTSANGWGDWVVTALCFLLGGYLLVNPLAISEIIGRFLGCFLIIHGLSDLRQSGYGSAKAIGILTAAAGAVLIVIPRTLVNTLVGVTGLVLLIVGIISLVDKLRHGRYLEDGGDPNIIDADE